jgi:hypothetical protein
MQTCNAKNIILFNYYNNFYQPALKIGTVSENVGDMIICCSQNKLGLIIQKTILVKKIFCRWILKQHLDLLDILVLLLRDKAINPQLTVALY